MLLASFEAVSWAEVSDENGELHFVKNVSPRNAAIIIMMCLKACMQRSGIYAAWALAGCWAAVNWRTFFL